jgi:4-oxalomesaconate hydratase
LLAAGAGVASAFKRITPPDLYFFEPHQPELCDFTPNTFVDITPVFEQKQKAMEVMKAQSYLQSYYTELASRRGNHARRISGMQEIKFAEAMQRTLPWVVKSL